MTAKSPIQGYGDNLTVFGTRIGDLSPEEHENIEKNKGGFNYKPLENVVVSHVQDSSTLICRKPSTNDIEKYIEEELLDGLCCYSAVNQGQLNQTIVDSVVAHLTEEKLPKVYQFIIDLLQKGQQCFIVFPLIEESENKDIKAAKSGYNYLKKNIFQKYNLGYIDGKMKVDERNTIMNSFMENKIHILVSTTVIEVGIDVPNATVMMIENAERFGLSQLHQLRGRTGRGVEKSYCILVERKRTLESEQRLKIMEKTLDGFKISDEDLKLRGPGEFFGKRQHGYMKMKIGNILTDGPIIRNARKVAFSIIDKDPHLLKTGNKRMRKQFIQEYSEMLEFVNIS